MVLRSSQASASVPATITVHGRFVRAPQITRSAAASTRATVASGAGRPVTDRIERGHSSQSDGAMTNETPAMTAVAPSAIARFLHSRRATNQSSPIPGVTFVRRTNDHAAGLRKPTTMAAASRISMLPRYPSQTIGKKMSSASDHRRPSHATASARTTNQPIANAGHGRKWKIEKSWAIAGL